MFALFAVVFSVLFVGRLRSFLLAAALVFMVGAVCADDADVVDDVDSAGDADVVDDVDSADKADDAVTVVPSNDPSDSSGEAGDTGNPVVPSTSSGASCSSSPSQCSQCFTGAHCNPKTNQCDAGYVGVHPVARQSYYHGHVPGECVLCPDGTVSNSRYLFTCQPLVHYSDLKKERDKLAFDFIEKEEALRKAQDELTAAKGDNEVKADRISFLKAKVSKLTYEIDALKKERKTLKEKVESLTAEVDELTLPQRQKEALKRLAVAQAAKAKADNEAKRAAEEAVDAESRLDAAEEAAAAKAKADAEFKAAEEAAKKLRLKTDVDETPSSEARLSLSALLGLELGYPWQSEIFVGAQLEYSYFLLRTTVGGGAWASWMELEHEEQRRSFASVFDAGLMAGAQYNGWFSLVGIDYVRYATPWPTPIPLGDIDEFTRRVELREKPVFAYLATLKIGHSWERIEAYGVVKYPVTLVYSTLEGPSVGLGVAWRSSVF